MQVESLYAVVGLAIIVKAVGCDFLRSVLQIGCLVEISGIFPAKEEVAVDESALDKSLKDASSTISRT